MCMQIHVHVFGNVLVIPQHACAIVHVLGLDSTQHCTLYVRT